MIVMRKITAEDMYKDFLRASAIMTDAPPSERMGRALSFDDLPSHAQAVWHGVAVLACRRAGLAYPAPPSGIAPEVAETIRQGIVGVHDKETRPNLSARLAQVLKIEGPLKVRAIEGPLHELCSEGWAYACIGCRRIIESRTKDG